MKKVLVVLALMVLLTAHAMPQPQSGRVFEFLNLPGTARITALGGYAIPVPDNDLGMALVYPSLLSQDINNHLSLNFVDYFDDINYGLVAFSHYFNRLGQFSAALQYIDYGRFTEADETGYITGEFTAGEYSLQVGWGRPLSENFMIGSNLKMIYSSFYTYESTGMAADVSFAYINPEHQLVAAIVARNIGRQITYYHGGNREPLPFDLMLGVSKKLNNAPFQFSLVANNLHNFDLTYESPLLLPDHFSNGNDGRSVQQKVSDFGDNLMRHLTLGLEFIPSRNFSFRMGYNYRRRQEMKVDTRLSTVGFSWGFGIHISRFQLHYGRSNYHLAGTPNHISLSTSLQDLFYRPNNKEEVLF
ncbi:MAG: type IX secretion system protein PorQ [Bacteroidales bacterium]|nr:type IX secretion system protein PorQ [Bacteroidales bacterium]